MTLQTPVPQGSVTPNSEVWLGSSLGLFSSLCQGQHLALTSSLTLGGNDHGASGPAGLWRMPHTLLLLTVPAASLHVVSSVPCGQERHNPLTGKEMKPRQEVCPGLKVGELAFEPRGPESQPGALLLPGVTTVDFHVAFSGRLGGQKLAPQRAQNEDAAPGEYGPGLLKMYLLRM